jgi:hypothetical protein
MLRNGIHRAFENAVNISSWEYGVRFHKSDRKWTTIVCDNVLYIEVISQKATSSERSKES